MIHTAYIGIGSNVGDRMKNILHALDQLKDEDDIELIKTSPIYESEALDGDGLSNEDPPFLNAVACIHTDIKPQELLRILQGMEIAMGRPAKREKNLPRTMDLDILLYDDLVLNTPILTVPHPRMAKRMFVLAPMSDIAPALVYPASTSTMAEMKELLGEDGGRVTEVK